MKSALYEQRHKSAIIAHTIGTHMNVDCLLKNIPTKHNKCMNVVNLKQTF